MTDLYLSPAEAATTWACPLARTFAKTDTGMCKGPSCAAWVPVKRQTDEVWRTAVKAEADRTGEKAPYAKAARAVVDDPEGHGLPLWDKGHCGLRGA